MTMNCEGNNGSLQEATMNNFFGFFKKSPYATFVCETNPDLPVVTIAF